MPSQENAKIVAVCLLTADELMNLRTGLKRVYPLSDGGDFADVLEAIEKATGKRPSPSFFR